MQITGVVAEVGGFSLMVEVRQPSIPGRSKIVKTRFFDRIAPHITKPAHLTPFTRKDGVMFDPYKESVMKYSHEVAYVDLKVWDKARWILRPRFLRQNVPAPWRPRKFTIREAICGIEGVNYVEAISRSTSAGYPFNLMPQYKIKIDLLGKEGPIDVNSDGFKQVERMVESILTKLKAGIRPEHYYTLYPKDERHLIEKADNGKLRIFMAVQWTMMIVF